MEHRGFIHHSDPGVQHRGVHPTRSTWRPFGPEPFGFELKVERLRFELLKAEGLSTG